MSNTLTTAQELNRAYQREWRRKNKDKVRQYNKSYWERKAEKLKKGAAVNE